MMAFQNLDRVIDQYRRLNQAIEEGAAAGLRREGELVLTESQKRVPRDTGTLAASAYTTEPKTTGGTVEIEIGYSAPYSTIVHESLDMPLTNGEHKFLESATNATMTGRSERIGRAITDAIREELRR
jgi:hypothetical protein